MQINEEALKLAIKQIEAEPESWNQTNWYAQETRGERAATREVMGVHVLEGAQCNTTMCLAGTVVHQAGWLPISFKYSDGTLSPGAMDALNPDTGEIRPIHSIAQQILGLSNYQKDVLFSADHPQGGVEEFKERVTAVTGVKFD